MKETEVNGIRWEYYTNSAEGAPAIVFAHGMAGAYDIWRYQIDFFKNEYKIISYTLPESINTLEDTLRGIEALLEKERINSFHIVGTSMGGYIAQYLIKQMPQRINKAVFGNTFPPNHYIEKANKTKSIVVKLLPETALGFFRKKSLKKELLPAGENSAVLNEILQGIPFHKKSFVNRYRIVTEYFNVNPGEDKYKKVPKLIIESDNDPLIPEKLREELKLLYPDAKVFTFHNKGHFPYINEAGQYNKTVYDFLKEK